MSALQGSTAAERPYRDHSAAELADILESQWDDKAFNEDIVGELLARALQCERLEKDNHRLTRLVVDDAEAMRVLRKELRDHDKGWEDALKERDWHRYLLDQFACGIASAIGIELGEHSSANDPWRNALEVLPLLADSSALFKDETRKVPYMSGDIVRRIDGTGARARLCVDTDRKGEWIVKRTNCSDAGRLRYWKEQDFQLVEVAPREPIDPRRGKTLREILIEALDPLGEGEVAYKPEGAAIAIETVIKGLLVDASSDSTRRSEG
jgi:hypothetical protein